MNKASSERMKLFLFTTLYFFANMISLKDQIDKLIEVPAYPHTIISLVPSITEYLSDLGLDKRVVGITKFCVHPKQWRSEKTIIGGTKQQDLEKVRELNPTLIIASKEENEKHYVEMLSDICPVYTSDVIDLESALQMMSDIGVLTGTTKKADEITRDIQKLFEVIEKPKQQVKVAYCIWKKPWMWAGADTYISKMLTYCGLENIVQSDRYPEVEIAEMVERAPDYIFLSTEPYPFQAKHIEELSIEFPNAKFVLVDGEMFSWYGSRMLQVPAYFSLVLNQLKSV